jgi:septum formation protein
MSRFILASNSPRRRQLLSEAGYYFKVVTPPWPEPEAEEAHRNATEFAQAASYFKARSVASLSRTNVILAADTVVARDGQIFGKPVDREDARRILSSLSGTTHEVITGVTVLDPRSGRRIIAKDRTGVTMRRMSPAQLEEYLDSQEWQDKAGAYGIQDIGDKFVERVDGSFSNVVGLPMELVTDLLERFDIRPAVLPGGRS